MQCVISAPLAALNEIEKILILKHVPVFHYLDKQIVLPYSSISGYSKVNRYHYRVYTLKKH